VVDEAAADALAKFGVVVGVQDERVPPLVHLDGRGKGNSGIERAGLKEREGLVYDPLGHGEFRAGVGDPGITAAR
jgi:hypothetical protein